MYPCSLVRLMILSAARTPPGAWPSRPRRTLRAKSSQAGSWVPVRHLACTALYDPGPQEKWASVPEQASSCGAAKYVSLTYSLRKPDATIKRLQRFWQFGNSSSNPDTISVPGGARRDGAAGFRRCRDWPDIAIDAVSGLLSESKIIARIISRDWSRCPARVQPLYNRQRSEREADSKLFAVT